MISVVTTLAKACLVLFSLLTARGLAWFFKMFIIDPPFDPLRNLPGPVTSALGSHFDDVMDPEKSANTNKTWAETYGKSFRFHGFGRHDYRLITLDFRSVSYILNSPLYEKPWQTRSVLSRLLGRGISALEGTDHKVLRKLLGPAFTARATRVTAPIFFQKAEELRDRWDTLLSDHTPKHSLSSSTAAPALLKETNIDIAHWASRATFDIIGLAGFDYHFHSLQDESEEVYLAYRQMFNAADKCTRLKGVFQIYFPYIEKILPDETSKTTRRSLRIIRKAGKELIENKRSTILANKVTASEIEDKDILSLLIKANLSSDPSKRLSDTVLLDQLSTLLFAGSDTTALAFSWCIHLLSLNPDTQTRLREEILSLASNSTSYSDSSRVPSPTTSETQSYASCSSFSAAGVYSEYARADAIEALPFLDSVVRETLRLCPPVHSTIRTPIQNDTIPISAPLVMRDGTAVGGIYIRKGTYVHIPIEGLNMSEDIWGKDAREFNPERWTNLPENARAPTHPGLANLMSFSLGPHSCLGWKFAIFEVKVFLAVILPHFVFAPAEKILKYNSILMRPYVFDQWEHGSRLPVKVQRYYPA